MSEPTSPHPQSPINNELIAQLVSESLHSRRLLGLVHHPTPDSQLISYMHGDRWVRATYSWLRNRLSASSHRLKLSHLTSHSLRRGGATALANADFSLLQIKDMGDWSSLAVLQYITRTLQDRMELDKRMCSALFCV